MNTDGCNDDLAGCAHGRFAPWCKERLGADQLRFPGPGRPSHRRVSQQLMSIIIKMINTNTDQIDTDISVFIQVKSVCIKKNNDTQTKHQTPAIGRNMAGGSPQSHDRTCCGRSEGRVAARARSARRHMAAICVYPCPSVVPVRASFAPWRLCVRIKRLGKTAHGQIQI